MRLDRRALAVAVVAAAIAVIVGYWAGAIAGVAAALASLVSAAVLQVAVNWQGLANARRARMAVADASFAPAVISAPSADVAESDGTSGGVARYLRPEAEVVRFWPRPELDKLVRWVISDERVSVRLVTGAGGSGKTRLARQLGEKVTDLGCRSWWVPAGGEADAVQAAKMGSVPVVLVADYAETRMALPAMLAAAAGDPSGPNLRILLLARSAGEWWQQLRDSSPYEVSELIATSEPITLGPVTDTADQQDVFTDALSAFAGKRGIPCPDAQLWLSDRDAVVLVVHAAALLAVLNAEAAITSTSTRQSTDDVLSRLLGHERRYWQQSLASRLVMPLDPDVTERVVAIGCLIGADDQESAMQLLTAVPDLADGQLRGVVARWLHDLYPVTGGAGGQEWIGQLRPDLIAERLVVTVLDYHPELISRLFAKLDESRAERALTMLARAALTTPTALGQIRQALEADPGSLIAPVLAAPTATNPDLVSVTGPALTSGMISADRREAVYSELARTDLNPLPYLGAWLNHQSAILEREVRHEEALAAIEEAVRIYRELARTDPYAFAHYLSKSQDYQSVILERLGRREEALAAIEEAVRTYREQADGNPFERLQKLSWWLNRQSLVLERLGRREDALAVIKQAVTIRRELAILEFPGALSDFAESLNNQSVILDRLGRREEELAAIEEAACTYRELTRAEPDEFLTDIATSLNVLRRLRKRHS